MPTRQILAINGSPHGEKGCTEAILQPLLQGMRAAGAETELVRLHDKKIHHCIGCMSCWTKTPGKCCFQDDMPAILEKVVPADLVIFGTPVYVYTMTGLLKNMIDRLLPLAQPFMIKDDRGLITHPGRYSESTKGKMMLVSPAGLPELNHFDSLVATFKQICASGGGEYLGHILRPAAGFMFIEPFQEKYREYSELLQKAGRQIVENNKIDEETDRALHELWINQEDFCKLANEHFHAELDKLEK